MPAALVRLIDAYRSLGFGRFLWVAPIWLIQREFLVLIRDPRSPLSEVHPPDRLRWTSLSDAEIPHLCAINPTLSIAEIQRRRTEGCECLLGWVDGSLAHYRWHTTATTFLPYLGKTFPLLEGDMFFREVYTHPAFRSHGIASVSAEIILKQARNLGLTRCITMVAWWNTPGLRVHNQQKGWTVVGKVGYWDIGIQRRYYATGDVSITGKSVTLHAGITVNSSRPLP